MDIVFEVGVTDNKASLIRSDKLDLDVLVFDSEEKLLDHTNAEIKSNSFLLELRFF